MRIIAIDPGYERLGVAVLEKLVRQKESVLYSSCIQTPRTLAHEKRLLAIANAVAKTVREWKPDTLAIETLFLHTNHKTAMAVAEARGAVLVEAARAGLTVYEYTPLQIKIAVTGYGRSDKQQVTGMVKKLIALPENKSLSVAPTTPSRRRDTPPQAGGEAGAPFKKGRIRLDDEYDAIAIGLTCFASTNQLPRSKLTRYVRR